MKKISVLLAALAFGAAQAQQSGAAGQGQRQLDPAMAARFKAMQPIFDLSSRISLLPELEKSKSTAVSKTQAKQLLPLLQKLQAAKAITPADATKSLNQIEDTILSDQQVTSLDDLDLKRQEARRAQRASGGNQGGFRIPGVPLRLGGQNQSGQGQAGQGQSGQGRQGQAGQNSQANRPGGPGSGPFNPFKEGRQADTLKAYIALLQKK